MTAPAVVTHSPPLPLWQGNDNRFDRFEVCQAAAERFCFSGP